MKLYRPLRSLRPIVAPSIFLLLMVTVAGGFQLADNIDAAGFAAAHLIPPTFTPIFTLITNLGAPITTVIVATIWTVYELTKRQYNRASLMAASLLGGPAYFLIKNLVQRARPITAFVTSHGLHDFSFPSGHTTGSTAVYGILAYLISQRLLKPQARMVLLAATALIFLIGFSRVYLGAHYPTDVIGGWLIGLTLISLLTALSSWWHNRHTPKVNPPGAG